MKQLFEQFGLSFPYTMENIRVDKMVWRMTKETTRVLALPKEEREAGIEEMKKTVVDLVWREVKEAVLTIQDKERFLAYDENLRGPFENLTPEWLEQLEISLYEKNNYQINKTANNLMALAAQKTLHRDPLLAPWAKETEQKWTKEEKMRLAFEPDRKKHILLNGIRLKMNDLQKKVIASKTFPAFKKELERFLREKLQEEIEAFERIQKQKGEGVFNG